MSPKEQVRVQARRAYEKGRLRDALLTSLLILVPAVACLQAWQATAFAAGVSALLFVAFGYAKWRGGELFTGALSGLVVGSLPIVFVLGLRMFDTHLCFEEMCVSMCVPMCFGSGLLAGLILAVRAQSLAQWRHRCCIQTRRSQAILILHYRNAEWKTG